MSGIIAIVGRPNVGKSALFNLIAGRRIAIVHDMPNLQTRELQKFGRAGVLLVLVYPGTKGVEPMIIPDSVVTTVFRGGLMEALARLRPAA